MGPRVSLHKDNFYLLKLASLKEIVQTPAHVGLAPVQKVVQLYTGLLHFLRWKDAISFQHPDKRRFTPAREVKIIDCQGVGSFVLEINDHLVPNANDVAVH